MKKGRQRKRQQKTNPKWVDQEKRVVKKRAKKQWLRFISKGLIVGIFLLLIFALLDMYRSVWDGSSRLTVALVTPKVTVYSFDPQKQEAIITIFPDESLIDAAFGFGPYSARSISGLDRQEGKKGELIRASLSYTLKTFIDGSLAGNTGIEISSKNDVVGFLGAGMWKKATGKIETNLSFWDLGRSFWMISKLRDVNVTVIDLVDLNIGTQVVEPDGQVRYKLDDTLLTRLANRWFTDEDVAREGIEVVIVNAAESFGLGGKVSQVLGSSGVHVIAVETATEPDDRSKVVIGDRSLAKSKTVKEIERWLDSKSIWQEDLEGRAPVVVTLGKDIAEKVVGIK